MRFTLPFLLTIILAAPGPGSAQDEPARRWVAEADRLQHTDAAATLRLTQQALPRLRARSDMARRMKALVLRCWAAVEVAPDSLLVFSEGGVAEAARAGDQATLGRLRVCRGYAYAQAGRLPEAMRDYDFGVAVGERRGDRELRADALVLRGEQRYYRGEFTAALADLGAAYRLYLAMDNRGQQRYTLNAIANLYADSRVAEYDRALEYYRQVLAADQAAGSRQGIATAHFNLGSTLERKGNLEGALAQYRRALAMDLERGDPQEAAVDRRAVGVVLYKLGRPAEALAILDRALAFFQKTGNEESIAGARISRGVALRMLGRADEALAELEAARAHFQAAGNQRFLEKVHEERALAFAAAGRWREAFQARSEQLVLQRALSDQAREEQTSRLRIQFDAEKKERENAALQRENALHAQALAASTRIRRLQAAVLGLSALVIVVLLVLAARQFRHARRLRVTALTDELTRLPNRRHLLLLADEQLRGARTQGTALGVLAVDVDHFKQINDTFGHHVGDAVLRRVAEALRAALRNGDHVGRVGGEEFVALLPGASAPDAAEIAERVRGAVERTDFGEVHPALSVTVSVGAAVREAGDTTFAAIYKRADDTLYRAKAAGRNRVEVAVASV